MFRECFPYRCRTNRRGAAAVEFAFVVPIVMLFAVAATDFGRIVHAYMAVSNAARCGAEYGASHGFTSYTRSAWETSIESTVTEELQNLGGFNAGLMQVDVATSTDSAGLYRVAVTVNYPFQTAVSWVGLPSYVMMGKRVEMRRNQ